MKNIFDIKLLKFLFVGILNTVIGAGTMFLLYNVVHCSYWISSACNYIVGGIVSFILNKFFTFGNKEKSLKQFILFVLLLLVCYVIAYVGAKYFIYVILENRSETMKDNVAMCIGMFLYTGLNYIGQRFIVFNNDSKGEK